MAQITVTFDKPENAPGVCDELRSYLGRIENAVADGRGGNADALRELYEIIDRLIGNLQE